MRNIILIGFMGAGKTAAAEALEKKGLRQIDTDACIVSREGRTIPEIFAEDGEARFRELESELLTELTKEQDLVISCGGGMALREENRRKMKACGTVVLLTAEPETILKRVGDAEDRPLLRGRTDPESVRELLAGRMPAYTDAADLLIQTDTKTPEAVADEILARAASFQEKTGEEPLC